MGRLCLIPCRTPLSGMTFNQFARKTITSLNGCQGSRNFVWPQLATIRFLDKAVKEIRVRFGWPE
jgi:hypothetical protein